MVEVFFVHFVCLWFIVYKIGFSIVNNLKKKKNYKKPQKTLVIFISRKETGEKTLEFIVELSKIEG